MDVNAGWGLLPIKLNDLIRLSTPLPKKVTNFLKKLKLTPAEVDDSLLRMIDQDELLLAEVNQAPTNIARELLLDKEVIVFLSDGTIAFAELLEIHSQYIENSNNALDTFSFKQFYNLIIDDKIKLDQLLSELGLSINAIIKLYNEDYTMFCAFANDSAISFLQKYSDEIDIGHLAEIYRKNQDLFYAMIDDQKNILQDIGVGEFIEKFEQVQAELEDEDEDSPYCKLDSAYDILVSRVIEDGCPEGYALHNNSADEESEYDRYESSCDANTDEEDLDSIVSQLEGCGFSEEDTYSYGSRLQDDAVYISAQDSNLDSSDEDYYY